MMLSPLFPTDGVDAALLDYLPGTRVKLRASKLQVAQQKYLIVIRLAQEALQHYLQGNSFSFYPLVGDHLCQVRAVMFPDMRNQIQVSELAALTLSRLTAYAAQVEAVKITPKTPAVDSFKAWLEQNKLVLTLPETIHVMVSSYLLTMTLVVESRSQRAEAKASSKYLYLSPKILSDKAGTTVCFANSVLILAREKLSQLSCAYMHRLARLYSDSEKAAAHLVLHHTKIGAHHLDLTPCHPGMRLLLKYAYDQSIPIVLRITQKGPHSHLSLTWGNRGEGKLSLYPDFQQPDQKDVICVLATSPDVKNLKSLKGFLAGLDIADFILSGVSHHPPYGNDETITLEDPDCERHQRLAEEWGTCRKYSHGILLEHFLWISLIEQPEVKITAGYSKFKFKNNLLPFRKIEVRHTYYDRGENEIRIYPKNSDVETNRRFVQTVLDHHEPLITYWHKSSKTAEITPREKFIHSISIPGRQALSAANRLIEERCITFETRSQLQPFLEKLEKVLAIKSKAVNSLNPSQRTLIRKDVEPRLRLLKAYLPPRHLKDFLIFAECTAQRIDDFDSFNQCLANSGFSASSPLVQHKVANALFEVGKVMAGKARLEKHLIQAGPLPSRKAQAHEVLISSEL